MPLRVRDTLSERVGRVEPPTGGPVRLYVCGPDVYALAHVGHARTYLYFDIVRRYLREEGRATRHVMNITDFADKITNRAMELGISWQLLARAEETRFLDDLERLCVLRPHVTPRASSFVGPMIEVVRRLERMGRVRREGDEWYYVPSPRADSRNFPVGRELADHAVPEPGGAAPVRDVFERDFMVWKRQEPPAPSWPSPWGPGMPGWHLECYTMAERYLGLPVDLHGGGMDLIYPHHYAENEIALTLENRLFARRFLHTAFVTLNRNKMAKSTGELVSLRSALRTYGADALRFYLMSRPYHTRLEWKDDEVARAAEQVAEIQHATQASAPRGSSGQLPIAPLHALVAGATEDIGNDLGIDRVMERLLRWANWLRSKGRPRFAASRREVAAAYGALERLTGLHLLNGVGQSSPSHPPVTRRPVRRAG
ncbi:MAG: class I tRNA ligase family protein [Thermoplasmata archaeon]